MHYFINPWFNMSTAKTRENPYQKAVSSPGSVEDDEQDVDNSWAAGGDRMEGVVESGSDLSDASSDEDPLIPAPGQFSGTGRPTDVRVLCWNLYMRPPPIKSFDGDWKEDRLKEIIEHVLPKYDLICFQELFRLGSSRHQRVIEAAAKVGLRHCMASPIPGWFSPMIVDGGCTILSRYPFVETDSIVFPRGVEADGTCAKGAVYARIALRPDYYVHVFCTHLQASYFDAAAKWEHYIDVRNAQAAALAQWILTKARYYPGFVTGGKGGDSELAPLAPFPIWLMGDFNVDAIRKGADKEAEPDNPHSPEYSALVRALMTPFYTVTDLKYDRLQFHTVTSVEVLGKNPISTPWPDEVGKNIDHFFYILPWPARTRGALALNAEDLEDTHRTAAPWDAWKPPSWLPIATHVKVIDWASSPALAAKNALHLSDHHAVETTLRLFPVDEGGVLQGLPSGSRLTPSGLGIIFAGDDE